MTRSAVLCLSLACLAAASAACSALDTIDAAESSTVAEAVTDGTKAVEEAPGDTAAPNGPSGRPKPPSSGAPAGARTGSSAARSRSRAPAEGVDRTSAGSPPAAHGESPEPGIASSEPVNRETVHEAPSLLAAAPAAQASPAAAPPRFARSDRIYSAEDPEITPAVLLTTSEAGPIFQGMQGAVNTMELVISREGFVETVRLLTPAARMTDMLLLSGAKTWKFAPALKDGQPVRYRTRFNWESTP